jgi:hypothetical protein
MFSSGIVNPTKVMRLALQDASSIAGLLITTEVLVPEMSQPPVRAAANVGNGVLKPQNPAGAPTFRHLDLAQSAASAIGSKMSGGLVALG